MKRFILAAVCLFALGAQAKLKVVASISDLGALAREAGGELVQVDVLAKPTQDPHFVDARHSLIITLSNADLLLFAGMDLEVGWLPTLMTSSRNGKVQLGAPGNLNCGTLIQPLEVPKEKVERSMGDLHPGGNPHYTRSPKDAVRVVKGIAARLSQLDPEHAKDYAANAAKFEELVTAKDAEWTKALAPFKGKPIITFHRSWSYFAAWAGLDVVAYMEPKPGLPPAMSHVAQVTTLARQKQVKVILQEEWYSAQSSQFVADKSGAKVVRVPGGVKDGQRWTEYLDGLVKAVVEPLAAPAK